MDVTIIMPLFNPDRKILRKIDSAIKNQNYPGKIKVLKIDEGLGLADSLNLGITNSKTEIVVSLHQDCVPSSENWLTNLVAPLEKKDAVASVSKVELPEKLWKRFSWLAKIMSAKEQRIITPLLDEKGCAYKKSALKKAGMFDGKTFRTAGEDFDMYLKLRKIGRIAYPGCKVFHHHKHTSKNRFKKELQLSEGFGVLVRIYSGKTPGWKIGILKSLPILGWPIFLINFPYRKVGILGGASWVLLSLVNNMVYSFGFWRGFLRKKQVV